MTHPVVPPSGSADIPPLDHDSAAESSQRTMRIIIFGILVAIFGGVAIFIVVRVLNPPRPAFDAGDCVEVVDGGRVSAQVEKAACAEQAALYEVGLYLDDPDATCPAESYSSYQQSGGREREFKLCLMLNAAEGDCLRVPTIAMGEEKKVACSDEQANRRVTRVIDGTADGAACDPESVDDARVYPDPKRTVCLGPVAA